MAPNRKSLSQMRLKSHSTKNKENSFLNRLSDFSTTNNRRKSMRLSSLASQLKRTELDLEQKIDLEIKMREGSAKLLAACNNSKAVGYTGNLSSTHKMQILEAAKNLLTSNERMTAYMAELQRRKRDRIESHVKTAKQRSTANLSLSEIRMPLMWRDSDHFKNKGDHRRFAVFCLVRIGTDILNTSLLCPVDRSLTDVSFNDTLLFSNVEPDFELTLEVYAVMMETDLTIASTPRKIKNTIHSSISRTVGKRLASTLKDELNNSKIGPKFELIATAILTLAEASDLPHTHDLRLNAVTSATANICQSNKLPLFGHFCCRLAVQPDFIKTNYACGDLQLMHPKDNQLISVYARLQAYKLSYWTTMEAFNNGMTPLHMLEVSRDTKMKRRGDLDFVLCNMEEGSIQRYIFRTKDSSEASNWEIALKRSIREHLLWKHVTLGTPMQISSPRTDKNYFHTSVRHGSLYDQVPISNMKITKSQNVDGENGETADGSPKLRSFRSRANSLHNAT